MKKNTNIIIYLIVIIIIALLVWYLYSKFTGSNIEFKIKNSKIDVRVGVEVPIDYEINKEANIIWESDNKNVVTVTNGKVKGVGLGSTLVKGTVKIGDETVTSSCYVTTFYGDNGVPLNDVIIPEGELFITKGDNYQIPINYEPSNGYINSINYSVDDDNIVSFDGSVSARNIGSTDIHIGINQNITKSITVNVIDKNIEPLFSSRVKSIYFDENDVVLKINEEKNIKYKVDPQEAFIESEEWTSSDEKVVVVDNGYIIAKSSGEATIKLVVNNEIVSEMKVTVSVPVSGLTLKSSSNLSLRIGKTDTVKVEVTPSNASNKKLLYSSSNPSIIGIDGNGKVSALAAGEGKITVKSEDGNYSVEIPFNVKPKKGVLNGTGGIWGYKSSNDKTPVKAEEAFFRSLVSKGKGTLSGSIYTYTDSKRTYKYDLSKSILNADKRNILVRFYYPEGVDLSKTNTFTFLGGSGERNMSGYFVHLDKNRNEMSSSGIIVLVSAKSSYDAEDAMLSTDFIRSLVDQESGVRNAVAGYSMGGPAAGDAAEKGIYDRLIIIDSYFNYVSSRTKLKNTEVIIFSPAGDAMIKKTVLTLNDLKKTTYNDVTVLTNNTDFIRNYSDYLLIVNPGNQMGRGHGYVNISNARIFSYACS